LVAPAACRIPHPLESRVPVIAVDLGGTKISAALVADDGALLAREHALLAGRGGDDVASLLADASAALVTEARTARVEVPA
jgi:predicted NBD/HSP70 family sugar kinase